MREEVISQDMDTTPNLGNALQEEVQIESPVDSISENDVRNTQTEKAVDSVDSIDNDIIENIEIENVSVDNVAPENLSDIDVEPAESEPTEGQPKEISEPEEPPAEPTPDEIIAKLREDLAASEARVGEQMDKLQRTAAEFQNSKRRQEKQLADQIQRASLHAVEQILPVLDDLELAFSNTPADIPEEVNAWLGGFQKIQGKLFRILENQEVTAIESGGEFDPNRHDAISSEEVEEVESGHIIETLRAGYEHKGRILRPAMVRVAA